MSDVAIIHKHAATSEDEERFYVWTKDGYMCAWRNASPEGWNGHIVKYVKTEAEAQKFLNDNN